MRRRRYWQKCMPVTPYAPASYSSNLLITTLRAPHSMFSPRQRRCPRRHIPLGWCRNLISDHLNRIWLSRGKSERLKVDCSSATIETHVPIRNKSCGMTSAYWVCDRKNGVRTGSTSTMFFAWQRNVRYILNYILVGGWAKLERKH